MVKLDLPEGCTLYPFQWDDLDAWCSLPGHRVLWNCNDMGLGKSVDSVVCAKACNYDRILIVTLASVRPDWTAHFARWWPEREPPAAIDRGFARKAMSKPEIIRLQAALENRTHIVSSELLPKLVELHKQDRAAVAGGAYQTLYPYDYIVVDEFHEYRSYWSKAFQALKALREMYPQADLKALSGTPMGADPLKAWPWLKLSEPHKWGALRKGEQIPFIFRKTYGERQESEFAFSGYTYTGVNQEKLPQFRESVKHLIRRRTAAEAGIELPPMRFELKRHPMAIATADAAVDWAESAIAQQPVAVFTHNHAPLAEIQAVMDARNVPYVRLYDEQTETERRALVADAEAHQKVILATTGLVSTGVNYLANIRNWMLAQPCENPVEIMQLARRFARISSKDKLPRIGFLLYREGEEFSAQQVLGNRLKTDKEIVTQSADAADLEQIVAGRSNQSFLEALMLMGRSLAAYGNADDEDDFGEAA